MKIQVPKLSKTIVLAASLLFVVSAEAAITTIATPTSAYLSSTTLLPITGTDGDTTSSLSDLNLNVSFSTVMLKASVPTTWTNWSSPPNAETSTPNVLTPLDFTINTITLSFSQPLSTFGLEAEPDALPQYGTFPVSLAYYSNATLLGTITQNLDGATSRLFAASSSTPITSVVLTISGNGLVPEGTDPGIAQLRYALATPEPATLFTCGGMLALLVGLRRMRSARN